MTIKLHRTLSIAHDNLHHLEIKKNKDKNDVVTNMVWDIFDKKPFDGHGMETFTWQHSFNDRYKLWHI